MKEESYLDDRLPSDKEIREAYVERKILGTFSIIDNEMGYWEYAAQWMRHKANDILKDESE